jgi:hypothetical protein
MLPIIPDTMTTDDDEDKTGGKKAQLLPGGEAFWQFLG